MPEMLDLTLDLALRSATTDEAAQMILQRDLSARLASVASEHALFTEWCRRADELYYSTTFTKWGADLWADDPSSTTPGRSHVSVNTPATYVDVPAALQAFEPIENMLALEDSDDSRHAAAAFERARKAWKFEEGWALKRHKATTTKSLYGKTASYVYWDADEGRACADVIQNPRNLRLGYKSDDYEKIEWAAHVSLADPNAVMAEYSVDVSLRELNDGRVIPWIGEEMADRPRGSINYGPARVEVWDYWYLLPAKRKGQPGKRTKMETWNVVVAGNAIVSGPYKYVEYDGVIPYVPLFNTFIPGTPTGRSELHDMEPLIREQMQRITSGAQMINGATSGDYWQLVGADAPMRVPPGAKPRRGEVATPGAGNRIETITPFIAQFQLDQYLQRIDRYMAIVSGLNDLLLGLAPAQTLNSSKAINALIANYETRLSMRRRLLYTWDLETWELVVKVSIKRDANFKKVVDLGGGRLDIVDPSLAPRDDDATAVRARSLVDGKLWSQARGMDAVGVDDPEQEQNIIRAERTDATMFPADVQVMAQLMQALNAAGVGAPAGVAAQGQATVNRGQNDLRTALGGQAPGDTGAQGVGDHNIPSADAATPGAGGAPASAPFAQAPAGGQTTQYQGMIQNGKASGRILTSSGRK